MKAVKLTREEMLEKSRNLYRNISARIKRIQKIENAPEYAISRFRELQEEYPRDIRQLSDEKLRKYYRQLRYINSLKSSRVSDVIKSKADWAPVKTILDSLSLEKEIMFWATYGKLYEELGIVDRFKYDILQNIAHRTMSGEDMDDILNSIIETFRDVSVEYGGNNDEEFSIRFAEELDKFL